MRKSLQQNLPPMEVHSLDQQLSTVDRQQSTPVQNVDRDRQQEWNAMPGQGLAKAEMSRKFAAAEMELDPSLLTAQLQGRKHLSWQRLYCLGPKFALELVLLIIEFYDLQIGLCEQDRRDLELGRTVRQALQRSLAR